MRVTSGFIYYFIWLEIALTLLTSVLVFKKIRHLTFNILNKLKIAEFPVSRMLFAIVFVIIGVVMFDSIVTYISIKDTLGGNYCIYFRYERT